MNVIEARRTRHLILRVDRGEEIPSALLRALDQAEARAGWINGAGSLESAEIALFDQHSRTYGRTRRIDGPCDVVSLTGNVALLDGAGLLRLTATLSRETELGLSVFAGELVWARAYALEIHATIFDDISLLRSFDERTGLALLREGSSPEPPRVAVSPIDAPRREPSSPTASPTASSTADFVQSIPLPNRPASTNHNDEVEIYPDAGDLVSHFHFGECSVISSDGDRIRLRQERDGRVREVALTMLRIEPPTIDAEGRRHFRLGRKN